MKIDFVYWIRGAEHAELARLSMASVRKVYGDRARFVVYTDDPDNTPLIEGSLRIDMPRGNNAMVANVTAQLEHLLCADDGQQVLFLDTDTLMRSEFPFGPGLTVTWRDHDSVVDGKKVIGVAASMPYNYGVLGVTVTPATRETFAWLKARVLQMSVVNQRWYGNQLALADLCGGVVDGDKLVMIRWNDGDLGRELRVTMLPCEIYNYSPETENEDVSNKVILHMKGKRKHLMAHYAVAA